MAHKPPIGPNPPKPPKPPRRPSPGGKMKKSPTDRFGKPGAGIPVPQPRPTEPNPDAPTPSTTGNIPAAKVIAEFGKQGISTGRDVARKFTDQATQEAEQVNQDTTEAIESTNTGQPMRKRRGRRNLVGSTPFGSSGGSLL